MELAVKGGMAFVIGGFVLAFLLRPTLISLALSLGLIIGGFTGILWTVRNRQ